MSATKVNTMPIMPTEQPARKSNTAHETAGADAGSFGQMLEKEVTARKEAMAAPDAPTAVKPNPKPKLHEGAVKKAAQHAPETVGNSAENLVLAQLAGLPASLPETQNALPTDTVSLAADEQPEGAGMSAAAAQNQLLPGMANVLQFPQPPAFTSAAASASAEADADSGMHKAALGTPVSATGVLADATTKTAVPDLSADPSGRDAQSALNAVPQTAGAQNFADTISQQANFNLSFESKLADKMHEMQSAAAIAPPLMLAEASKALPANPMPVSNEIAARFGAPNWNEAVGQKVVWMVGSEQQTATLTLNPPDLGPVQVVIAVHNDQADTTFISQNPEVRQALQDGLENLRHMMSQAGVTLGQTQVQAEQQGQPQASQQNAGKGTHAASATDAGTDSTLPPAVRVRAGNGLVDTFA